MQHAQTADKRVIWDYTGKFLASEAELQLSRLLGLSVIDLLGWA